MMAVEGLDIPKKMTRMATMIITNPRILQESAPRLSIMLNSLYHGGYGLAVRSSQTEKAKSFDGNYLEITSSRMT